MDFRGKARSVSRRFGSRLKAARRKAGFTQEQLAEAIGFSPISLSKLETGASTPSFEVFVALTLALDVRPDFLAGWESGDQPLDAERRALLDQLLLLAGQLDSEWIGQLVDLAQKAMKQSAR